jgi:hypothetical protein
MSSSADVLARASYGRAKIRVTQADAASLQIVEPFYVGQKRIVYDQVVDTLAPPLVSFAGRDFVLNTLPTDVRRVPHLLASEVFPAANLLNLPTVVDYRPEMGDVRQQGGAPLAPFIACATIKEWQERNNRTFLAAGASSTGSIGTASNGRVTFSAEFLADVVERNRQEALPVDEEGAFKGTSLHTVLSVLQRTGVPTQASYRRAMDDVGNGDKNAAMLAEAQMARIDNVAFLDTIESTRVALVRNGPSLLTLPCYNSSTTFWKPTRPEEKCARGGQPVVVVGYTPTGFILRNSWGTGWGDAGHCILPFAEVPIAWEGWTCVDEKSALLATDRTKGNCLGGCVIQ